MERIAVIRRCDHFSGGDVITGKSNFTDGKDLVQLVYVSEATAELDSKTLSQIEASARRNNEQAGLTGFLIYQGLKFYGLLEGHSNPLLGRMEVIVTDPRHRRLRVLREQEVESRRFRNWSFAALPHPSASRTVEPLSDEFIRTLASRLS